MFRLTMTTFWRLIPGQDRSDGPVKTRKMTGKDWKKYGMPNKTKQTMRQLCRRKAGC